MEGKLTFPVSAQGIAERRISPLKVGEAIQVTGMAPEEECDREMCVEATWRDRLLAVPLAQLKPVEADEPTQEVALDWQCWVARGYELAEFWGRGRLFKLSRFGYGWFGTAKR